MPDWKKEISERLNNLNLSPAREAEIVEELSQHLEDRYRELLSSGASEDEARRATLAESSDTELFTRELRWVEQPIVDEPVGHGRPGMFVGGLHDLRYGLRMLRKSPGYTFIAVLTLALGVGANTAIFSVVNAVLLRPLPYPESDRLAQVFLSHPGTERNKRSGFGNADFLALKERNQSFDKVAAVSSGNRFSLTGKGTPEQVVGAVVTAEFFDVLGAKPLHGRTFLPDEDRPGSARAVVVSHGFWQTYLNSDPEVIGEAIALNNESHTIIGVMKPDFRFSAFGPAALWTTLQIQPPRFRPPYYLRVLGRLKPNMSHQEAQTDLSVIARQLLSEHPNSAADAALVEPLKRSIVGDSQAGLSVLLGAVLFVLLIATVNVANLLLARAAAREKEMAVRLALGASRFRLIRQALTESCLLALFGGALGLLLAFQGVDLIAILSPDTLPRLDEINLDRRVLGFTMLITVLSGLLFGLAPALQGSRSDLQASLKEGGRSVTEGFSKRRLRSLLIVSEVALALMLLAGAGLMTRSFLQLQGVNPGFNPDRLLTAMLVLPRSSYTEAGSVGRFQQQLLQRVQSLPGVEATSVSMSLPPDLLMMNNPFTVEGQPPAPGQALPVAAQLLISPDYFRTLGIRLRMGRPFTDADNQDAPEVIIINSTMARRYFPNQDPLGKRIQTGDYDPANQGATIVGVVDDVKYNGLNKEIEPTMYTPFLQNLWWRSMYLAVRTSGDPLTFVSSIRNEVWAIDRDLPVSQIKAMDQLMSESVAEPRAYTLLLGLFAFVALSLAAVGVYGLMSYTVSRRTHEIGIRMALGAQPGNALRLIIGQGMKLVLTGVAAGLVGAFALTNAMTGLLFEVSPTDPMTFALIALMLIAVALLACYIPARRATKVDPLVALRIE